MHAQSEIIKDLATALARAQAEITGAIKASDNPFYKSKYADLATCMEAIRGPLAANGLCVIQTLGHKEGAVVVYTTLAHATGQWVRGECVMVPEKPGPQALGACISYARRYSLAIVGLVQIDDDAESATDHDAKPEPVETIKATDNSQTRILKSLMTKCESMAELQSVWESANASHRTDIGAEFLKSQKERLEFPA